MLRKSPYIEPSQMQKQPIERIRAKGPSSRYEHRITEKKWQVAWEKNRLDEVPIRAAKKPYYNLMMFPYPSAEGLHVGNMYAFTGADIYGRLKRMQGFDVFEPIGLDGFGIHSENYALKIGRHPIEQSALSEEKFYGQLRTIGAMFDWSRSLETYDPRYYRWTQWLFVQMFKHGLAYRKKTEVNWCPSCKTVLADEQVINGLCERCGNIVEKRLLEQWFFKITAFAEKLLSNLHRLDWSEKVKVAQIAWIGRKEGVEIVYPIIDDKGKVVGEVTCFTTRPDTNFGAEFVVLSPEHPIINQLIRVIDIQTASKIKAYVIRARKKSKEERIVQARKKTGIFTGLHCVNRVNGYRMMLYVSDFVVMDVGTGAVVGVPGADLRDFEFAREFQIPIRRVVVASDGDATPISKPGQVQEGDGTMVNSDFLNDLSTHKAIKRMTEYLEKKGWGKRMVTYHLRDWLISRQRYWGPPIPMIYCEKCAGEGNSWFTSDEAQSFRMKGARGDENFLDPLLASESKKQSGDPNNKYSTHSVSELGKRSSKILSPRASDTAGMNVFEDVQLPAASVQDDNRKLKIGNSTSWAAGWYPVPENDLPVLLPRIEDYQPRGDGKSPLARHEEFYRTSCPGCGSPARRETDVSDTFLDSSWYYLRYPSIQHESTDSADENFLDPLLADKIKDKSSNPMFKHSASSDQELGKRSSKILSTEPLPWDPEITRHWLPVDMYTGGAEHSVLHLMYSRFVTMALHDWGYLHFDEPFTRFYAHGLVIKDGAKMSKSKGNVVNPDDYIATYGADSLRLYLMFMGPFDQGGDFNDAAMEGMSRWVKRVWKLVLSNLKSQISNKKDISEIRRVLHKLIKKVTEDIEKRRYNTAIAAMMEFTNTVADRGISLDENSLKTFLMLLAPFAPFVTEELWQQAHGRTDRGYQAGSSIHRAKWPGYDQSLLHETSAHIVVQVDGKTRDVIELGRSNAIKQGDVETLARSSERVKKYLQSATVSRIVFIPEKLINFVTAIDG